VGRIGQDDIDRALEYQQREGGFFGQALVDLEILRQDEVEWGLASQFDLPYIFPDPEAVDPEAAHLVKVDWALAHLAIPVARDKTSVTLAVTSPLQSEAAREVEAETGLHVELALASADRIRRVIRHVFAPGVEARGRHLAGSAAISVEEFTTLTQLHQASRWGVSVRQGRALGWYEDEDEVRRFRLRPGWETTLEHTVSPSPEDRLPARGESAWLAKLQRGSQTEAVEVRGLSTPSGYELLFTPTAPPHGEVDVPPDPPEAILAELRLLVEGGLTLELRSRPPVIARKLLPRIPELVLPPGHRTVHLSSREEPVHETSILTLPLEGSRATMATRLAELREFRFDAAALELDPEMDVAGEAWAALAPVRFQWRSGTGNGRDDMEILGVDWVLELERDPDDEWIWSLRRLHSPFQ
jgi:type IV pilus assembly protein PilB